MPNVEVKIRKTVRGATALLQERFGRGCPWRVAVICTCLNRTRGARAAPILAELFRRWPNAWAMDAASTREEERRDVEALLHPLGFFDARAGTVFRLSDVAASFYGTSRAGHVVELAAVRGVGPYAVASMRAFCLGDLTVKTTDRILADRLRWLRRKRRR